MVLGVYVFMISEQQRAGTTIVMDQRYWERTCNWDVRCVARERQHRRRKGRASSHVTRCAFA